VVITPASCTAINLNLSIGGPTSPLSNLTTATSCGSYTWAVNGMTYNQSGLYTATSTNGSGCTVNETLNLTINTPSNSTVSATTCDSYTWACNGQTYTQSGSYICVGVNAGGCPDTTTLNLTINPSTSSTVSATACNSYTWACNGQTYTQSGSYTCTGTNANGCLHTTTLNLVINSSTSSVENASACNSYIWACNGMTYTQSGTYSCSGINAAGCPHTTTLNLTINSSTTSTVNATACGSFTWGCNGMTYTQSGSYTCIGTNANGCLHTTTLNLTINNSASPIENVTACNSYTWGCNGMTYTQSGTYTCNSTGSNGCPSVITLNLTINASTTGTTNVTVCDSYTWSENGQTYLQSGVYTASSTNAAGCTHTQTLNLTINSSTSSTVAVTACNVYTWGCNGQNYTQSGTYTCTGTNAAGCPHTTTLNLVINTNTSSTVSATACTSYLWSCNGQTYTQSGNYTCTGTNANGCAHVTTLNLTINNCNVPQTLPYECIIKNINQLSPTVMEFDVFLTNLGSSTLKLNAFQGGIDFNYTGMAGTGTITGSFVTGSNSLPAPQNNPNWNINATSKQIRLLASVVTSSSAAASITSTPLKLGTFRMTNTVPFTPCVTPNFTWSFVTAANKTKSTITAWIGTGTSPVSITDPAHAAASFANGGGPQHFVQSNPMTTCCPSTASYVGTDPICYGGMGSAVVTVTGPGATASTSGSYSVDGGSLQLFSANPITVTGLSTGSHILVITPTGCASFYITVSIGGPTTPLTNTTNISACGSYTWPVNGMTYTQSGSYSGTTTNSNGCTVLQTLNLTVNTATSATYSAIACDTYTWACNGQTYTQSGTYTCLGTNAAGCVHTTILNLTINSSTSSSESALACDSYTWACNGQTYTQSGTYTCTGINSAGCLHTTTLNLIIHHSTSSTISVTTCNSYTWSCNGQTYSQSGTYTCTGTNASGCPNTTILNLTVNNSTSSSSNLTACNSYTWSCNNQTYTQSGTYTCFGTNAAGCNHTTILNLTINSSTSSSENASACDSYTWGCNGQTYTQSGTYTCTGINSAGCIHTTTLNLIIHSSTSSTISATACNSYTWGCNGQTYTQSGTYTCTGTNTSGCPSTTVLNLTINSNTSSSSSLTVCDSYTWSCNNQTYTQSGTYSCIGTNAAGCVHVSVLNLTVNYSTSGTAATSACNSYTWGCNGQTYTQSGTYTCVGLNSVGCPHATTLNLTVNSSTTSTMSAIACNSYTWSCNGQTYNQSGTYSCIGTNSAGCAHTTILSLTINNSTSSVVPATACNSYTWPCTGQTYTQSGNYTCNGLNSSGCPHTTTLQLTINNSTTSAISATACNSYLWSCNSQTYTQSGTYSCVTLNSAGCTHINVLNLNINSSTTSSQTASACNSFTWPCNGQTYTQSGMYTCYGTNPSGCPHVTTLQLAVGNSTSSTVNITACNSFTWGCNGQTYTQSGLYTCMSTNASGCPHTNILNLVINNSTTSTTNVTACNGYFWGCNSQTYTQTGSYTCSTINSVGCTQVNILNLIINTSTTTSSTAVACNSYTWGCNSQTYTQSGVYTCSGTNTAGCTQTNILNLTINNSTTVTTSASACNSYTWACNNQTYTQSGTYSCSGTNATGCPQTTILSLIINNGTTSTSNVTACNSYTWTCNNQTYTQGGIYTCNTVNGAGCTNVSILNLVVNYGTSSTTTATACGSYFWSCNNQTYTTSGSKLCTSINSVGCTQLTTLNLIINPVPVVTAGSVSGCSGSPITLIGSPTGGTFNLGSPYTGTATSYTYTYTSPQGCTATATGTISYTNPPAVTNLTASNITSGTALISWTGFGAQFEIRYRKTSSTAWLLGATNATLSRTLTALSPSSTYTVEVRASCTSTSTPIAWVGITFTTPSCSTPVITTTTNITMNSAKLNWTHPGALNYNVRYRKLGVVTWTNVTAVTASTLSISGLLANSVYEFQVQGNCPPIGAWTGTATFTTLASKMAEPEMVETMSTAFNVYPNPTKGMIRADVTMEHNTQLQMEVVDMTGRKVKQYDVEALEGINQFDLDLSNMSNGIYSIRFLSNGEMIYQTRVTKSE